MVNVRVSPEKPEVISTSICRHEAVIVVRVSGTEPLIRVMVEGEQEETINRLANEVADVIREKLV